MSENTWLENHFRHMKKNYLVSCLLYQINVNKILVNKRKIGVITSEVVNAGTFTNEVNLVEVDGKVRLDTKLYSGIFLSDCIISLELKKVALQWLMFEI